VAGPVDRFSVIQPTDLSWRMNSYVPPASQTFATSLSIGVILVSLVTLCLLARRNLRLDRAYRAGAMRSAWLVGSLCLAGLILVQSWRAEFLFIGMALIRCVGTALFAAGCMWLAYAGLEPYLRRNAPHRSLPGPGSSRADGAIRSWVAKRSTGPRSERRRSHPGRWSGSSGSAGLDRAGRDPDAARPLRRRLLVGSVLQCVLRDLLHMDLHRGVSRIEARASQETVAWTAVGVLLAGTAAGIPLPAIPKLLVLFAIGVLYVIAFRTGQVCGTVAFVASTLLNQTPFTIGRWYAWRGYVDLAIVLAIAVYGFRISIGKKRLLPRRARSAEDLVTMRENRLSRFRVGRYAGRRRSSACTARMTVKAPSTPST
jgi:hypothetical protein